jgi:hypothetical protein
MKTIKLITTTLLTIFLVSCRGPQINPKVIGDISFQFDRCRVTCFDIMNVSSTKKERCNITKRLPKEWPVFYSLETTKKGKDFLQFNPGNYDLLTCDGLIGFHVDVYAKKVKPWAKKTIQYYKNKRR